MTERYSVRLSPTARRDIQHRLPEKVATAVAEFIDGDLSANPRRVGKPLDAPFKGQHVARRSTYRVIYRIDEQARTIFIVAIKPRAHIYRA